MIFHPSSKQRRIDFNDATELHRFHVAVHPEFEGLANKIRPVHGRRTVVHTAAAR